jgi:hypothetical protein
MPGLAQNYAEYQDSAPELVSQAPQFPRGTESLADGELDPPVPMLAEKKKRFQRPVPIIAICLMAVLVLVGVIVGAVIGTQHKNHNRTSSIYLDVC